MRFLSVMLFIIGCVGVLPVRAQEQTTMPDLTGLNIPQAAAVLAQAQLVLGAQTAVPWSESTGQPQNAITTQTIAPGTAVPVGTAVDVALLRSANATLVYDENDFTLVNRTGGALDLNGVAFSAIETTQTAGFTGSRWRGPLEPGVCAQVWSISTRAPKSIDGCERIATWLTTNNPAEHFWTSLNGVVRFNVAQNGVEVGQCAAAPAGSPLITCDVFLNVGAVAAAQSEATEFIYFAYTTERLTVHNRSQNQWMPIAPTIVYNFNPNLTQPEQPVNLAEPLLFASVNPYASVAQLAPGQCLQFTNSVNLETVGYAEPCLAAGIAHLDPNVLFWTTEFEIQSVTTGERHRCAAANPERLTICIMPR